MVGFSEMIEGSTGIPSIPIPCSLGPLLSMFGLWIARVAQGDVQEAPASHSSERFLSVNAKI